MMKIQELLQVFKFKLQLDTQSLITRQITKFDIMGTHIFLRIYHKISIKYLNKPKAS